MIADELRRQADVFTDLVELQSKIGRDPSERPAPREPRRHAPQFLQRATTMAARGDDVVRRLIELAHLPLVIKRAADSIANGPTELERARSRLRAGGQGLKGRTMPGHESRAAAIARRR